MNKRDAVSMDHYAHCPCAHCRFTLLCYLTYFKELCVSLFLSLSLSLSLSSVYLHRVYYKEFYQ